MADDPTPAGPDDPDQPDPPGLPGPPDPQRLGPTSPAVLTVWAVVGLAGGWLLHPLAEWARGTAPIVTWAQPLALLLVAAILGGTAWITWRAVHVHRERLEPQRAVNRLVLARACALVGALTGGAYAGYAISWLGIDSALASQRLWRSTVAAVGGIGIAVTSLLLERACRVRSEDDPA